MLGPRRDDRRPGWQTALAEAQRRRVQTALGTALNVQIMNHDAAGYGLVLTNREHNKAEVVMVFNPADLTLRTVDLEQVEV
jgi:hypothetical protein